MFLQQRIELMVRLGKYLGSDDPTWAEAKTKAGHQNGWFTEEFVDHAASQVANAYLDREKLAAFCTAYALPSVLPAPKTVGLVMAGNIPLVGFHDMLCVFLSGHRLVVKPSSKDNILFRQILETLVGWDPRVAAWISEAEMLQGCGAYIATGSNNSARYFDYYFGKYPHIIRRNRTSVALLTGGESFADLEKLADDVHVYFGRGCRNVTKLYLPRGYDFVPLLEAFRRFSHFSDHHKYKNNYDYQLAILLLNNRYYMTNGTILLVENGSLFAPISQLNYEFYDNPAETHARLVGNPDIQCIIGAGGLAFGQAQAPRLEDFADGIDTLGFLKAL
jgi:hypothetical protein